MTADDVVQLFAAAGGATIITTVVNAVFNKRKLGAEATEIITKGAAGIVETVQADNARLRLEMAANEARHQREIGALQQEMAQMKKTQSLADNRERMHLVAEERNRAHLERWHRYCGHLQRTIESLNADAGEPPPLFPEPLVPAYPNDYQPSD